MAIDPSRGTPKDAATVSTLQSTTEESAKAAMRAPMEGAWLGARDSFIHNILDGLGAIISGTVQFAGEIFMAVVDGVVSLIRFTGQALESAWSWLTGGPRYDIPENFMPLEASAYAVLEPVKTGVDDALEAARTAEGDMVALQAELAVLLPEIAADVEEARRLAGEARDQLTAAQESNARTQQVVQAAVASGASSAGLAMAMAQEAIVLVDEADLILAEVRALNVLVGEHAQEALGHAATAREHAQTSSDLVDEGRGVLADTAILKTVVEGHVESAQSAVTDARQARDDASSSLSSARGVLDQVEDAGEDVQALHTQVLGLHQDTMTKHGEAIQAATDATGALADAVLVQQDITTKHGEVLTKHGEAIGAASAAAGSAADAAADVAAGLLVQQDITTKHGEVLTKHGEAIRLTASSSASAGMAAMQALMAADSLSETQDAHTSTLALHAEVIEKHTDSIEKLSTAVQLQEETARLQAIINRQTLTALEIHENLNRWRDDTRSRIGSTVQLSGNPSPWNTMCDGRIYVRSGDDRRRVEWTAPGSWAGKVIFLISWNTATLTGDDYFTNHYFMVEEGSRGTWIPSPKNLQYVRQVSVFIEPWWGMTKREFVVQVAGEDDGQFVPTSAYEAPRDMISFPTGQTRQPVTFAFDVTADHPVRASTEGGSPVWMDAGARIGAGQHILPAHQAGLGAYPAVVKFTEA